MHKGKSAFSPAIPRAFQVTQETGAPRAELIRGSWAKRPLDWKIKKISPSYNAKTGLGSDGNKSCGFPWERALQLRPLWDAFPLFSAPHAGMRQRRFCLPDKRHHRKTPSVRQTGAGGYVARLAAAPAAGVLPLWLPLQAPECVNAVLLARYTALRQYAWHFSRREVGRSV